MTKIRSLFVLALIAVLMAGCAGVPGLSAYSVSEATLERHLRQAFLDFDRQQLNAGSPISLSLRDADITLGPDGRDVAVISLGGEAAATLLGTRLPVNVALKVEGAPMYDSQEKAIFIRRLQLLESSVDSPLLGSANLQPVADNVMRLVAQVLETVPVYRLDESDARQRLLGMAGLDIRVAPGRIEFVRP